MALAAALPGSILLSRAGVGRLASANLRANVPGRSRIAMFQTRASGETEPAGPPTTTTTTATVEPAASEAVEPSTSTSTSLAAARPASEFKIPEPRKFYVRSDRALDVATAAVAPLMRLGTGLFAVGYKVGLAADDGDTSKYTFGRAAGRKLQETAAELPRPEKPIEIYEFEGCPFCRKVREAVSMLDLDVIFYPSPRDSPTYRPKVIEMGGKAQFPYMVDSNTGAAMYESDDIIKYLCEKYGDGNVPRLLNLGILTTLTAGLGMALRANRGSKYTGASKPEQLLTLWGYEGSPFVKLVREVLNELELAHLMRMTPRGSKKRQEMVDTLGMFQVPYLEDPNTGIKMFESAEIVDYLRATYGKPTTT